MGLFDRPTGRGQTAQNYVVSRSLGAALRCERRLRHLGDYTPRGGARFRRNCTRAPLLAAIHAGAHLRVRAGDTPKPRKNRPALWLGGELRSGARRTGLHDCLLDDDCSILICGCECHCVRPPGTAGAGGWCVEFRLRQLWPHRAALPQPAPRAADSAVDASDDNGARSAECWHRV